MTTAERTPDDTAGPTSCDAQVTRHDRAGPSDGRARSDPARARGCPQDHGQNHGKSTSGESTSGEKGGGRPDDPGSKGHGNGSSKEEKPGAGDDGSLNGGGNTVEHVNGGGSGNAGKAKEKARTGNGGRSEHGNAG